jgi:hypothetical protein
MVEERGDPTTAQEAYERLPAAVARSRLRSRPAPSAARRRINYRRYASPDSKTPS